MRLFPCFLSREGILCILVASYGHVSLITDQLDWQRCRSPLLHCCGVVVRVVHFGAHTIRGPHSSGTHPSGPTLRPPLFLASLSHPSRPPSLWASPFGAPTLRGPHLRCPHPSGPPPFGAHTFRGPHSSGPHFFWVRSPHPSGRVGAPPVGPPPLGLPPFGAPPFGAPPFGAPPFPTHTSTQNTQKKHEQLISPGNRAILTRTAPTQTTPNRTAFLPAPRPRLPLLQNHF